MKISTTSFTIRPLFCVLFFASLSWAEPNPLAPVKTDTPRATMETFYEAMKAYRAAIASNNNGNEEIDKAIRTLNLSETPHLLRSEKGREIAIYLKEVIDRMIVIDYQKIPDQRDESTWRLKNTEIIISKVETGEDKGQFLFSPSTVYRAHEFFKKVKKLPYKPGSDGGALYQPPWYQKALPPWTLKNHFLFPTWKWLALFLSILLGLTLKRIARAILGWIARVTDQKKLGWQNQVVSSLERPATWLLASSLWFASIYLIQFDGKTLWILTTIVQILFSFSVTWCAYRLVDILTTYLAKLAEKTENTLDDHIAPLVGKALRIFVVLFGVLVSLQNLGLNVLSLLAGLGLGGLAFALAAKDTCANLFGSIMIFFDRPFAIGDWIVAGDKEGTVEEIGFRSTRIRTFYNSVVSMPNSNVANMNIDNMGQRRYRRVNTTLGITYDTPPEKIEAFMEGIKNIIKANPATRKDYFHVAFSGYGSSSLNIMLYFFFEVPDWSEELVQRQNVYLEILRLAKKIGVEFAFPTQTLHMESFPEKAAKEAPTFSEDELRTRAKDFGPQGRESKPDGLGLFHPPYKET